MDNQAIKSYLKTILELETNKFTMKTAIDNTESTISKLAKSPKLYKPVAVKQSAEEQSYRKGAYVCFALAVITLIFVLIIRFEILKYLFIGFLVVFAICAIVLFIYANSKKNDRLYEDREREQEYAQFKERQEKRLYEESTYKEHLLKTLNKINPQLEETKSALEELYSINIIHPKYRNLIAIASFLEYFETGRCTQLEGHEGAYNIFENEVRLDMIITNQNQIIESLDQVKQNQYTLYTAIIESQRQIQGIGCKMNTIMSLAEQTAQNSEIIAYNSKCSADNTNALSNYIFWRDMLK